MSHILTLEMMLQVARHHFLENGREDVDKKDLEKIIARKKTWFKMTNTRL